MDFSSLQPAKEAKSLLEGFKQFAFKGNVIDLAVGVIIGGAFGNLIKSLVENVIMPTIAVIMPGKGEYQDWAYQVTPDKQIPFGRFLGDVVNFLIVSFALYLFIVKFIGWIMTFNRQKAQEPPKPTTDQQLLTEIRDLLKQQSQARPKP